LRSGLAWGGGLPGKAMPVPGIPGPGKAARTASRKGREYRTEPEAREERTGLAGAGVALRWRDRGRQQHGQTLYGQRGMSAAGNHAADDDPPSASVRAWCA
jgi:hypothetical protein